MDIQKIEDGKQGMFQALDDDKVAGEMHFTWVGDHSLSIDHTGVESAYRGRGIGRELLDALINFARQDQIKVIPLCPYAKSVFDKRPELQDVLRDA